jgi:hypothetical protein
MQFLHVTNSKKDLDQVNKYINEGKHVFLFIHSESCGHCIHAFPFWKQLKNRLAHKKRPDVLVADINAKTLSDENKIAKVGPINGYPTIKYIHGKKVEEFNQERTTDLFMNWIETNIGNGVSIANKTRKAQHGGWWGSGDEKIVPIDETNPVKMSLNKYLKFYTYYPYFKNPRNNNDIFYVTTVTEDDNFINIFGHYINGRYSTTQINIKKTELSQEIEVSSAEENFKGGSRKRSNRKCSNRKCSNRKCSNRKCSIKKRTIRKN